MSRSRRLRIAVRNLPETLHREFWADAADRVGYSVLGIILLSIVVWIELTQ